MTNEFDHDNEPGPEQWQCPCPECNGAGGFAESWFKDEDDALNECEPHPDELKESSWRWAE